MMNWVLIIFISTSTSTQSGAAAVTEQFFYQSRCEEAGKALVKQAQERGNHVLTWGCFKR